MSTAEIIKEELNNLLDEEDNLRELADSSEDILEFGRQYQSWYSKAIKIVESLAPERLEEFCNYYLIDPKRKILNYGNYVIQDYIKGVGARINLGAPMWDTNQATKIRVINQMQILESLASRVDSVIQDVTAHLFSELQDKELEAATSLLKISPRASGALAGVVLERHLQRTFFNHGLTSRKKNLTISDLNDPLKQKGVYGVPVWRKIQLLADIRNICSHQKDESPTKEQVIELIDGVNSIIKTVF